MILKNINIQNFKSIEDVDVQVNKLHDSYTTIFVGLNETGKSNLDADYVIAQTNAILGKYGINFIWKGQK